MGHDLHDTHVVSSTSHVAHRKPATVSGWFATADGTPLGNVPVNIMTAPDNGSYAWTTAAAVTTFADGSWQGTLPPGPSRLVEAAYAGGPLTEPATSPVINVIVPAKIAVWITPRSVAGGEASGSAGACVADTSRQTASPYVS